MGAPAPKWPPSDGGSTTVTRATQCRASSPHPRRRPAKLSRTRRPLARSPARPQRSINRPPHATPMPPELDAVPSPTSSRPDRSLLSTDPDNDPASPSTNNNPTIEQIRYTHAPHALAPPLPRKPALHPATPCSPFARSCCRNPDPGHTLRGGGGVGFSAPGVYWRSGRFSCSCGVQGWLQGSARCAARSFGFRRREIHRLRAW
jgi:hypothetical protein